MNVQTVTTNDEAGFRTARRVNQVADCFDGEARFALDGGAGAEVGELRTNSRCLDWARRLERESAMRCRAMTAVRCCW